MIKHIVGVALINCCIALPVCWAADAPPMTAMQQALQPMIQRLQQKEQQIAAEVQVEKKGS